MDCINSSKEEFLLFFEVIQYPGILLLAWSIIISLAKGKKLYRIPFGCLIVIQYKRKIATIRNINHVKTYIQISSLMRRDLLAINHVIINVPVDPFDTN